MAASESCILQHRIHDVGVSCAELQLEDPHPSTIFDTTDLKDVSGEKLIEKWPSRICEACRPALEKQIDRERERIWECIPSHFGLPDWDTLRRGVKE